MPRYTEWNWPPFMGRPINYALLCAWNAAYIVPGFVLDFLKCLLIGILILAWAREINTWIAFSLCAVETYQSMSWWQGPLQLAPGCVEQYMTLWTDDAYALGRYPWKCSSWTMPTLLCFYFWCRGKHLRLYIAFGLSVMACMSPRWTQAGEILHWIGFAWVVILFGNLVVTLVAAAYWALLCVDS